MSYYQTSNSLAHSYYSNWVCSGLHKTYSWIDNVPTISFAATLASGIIAIQNPQNLIRRQSFFLLLIFSCFSLGFTGSLKNFIGMHFWTNCSPNQISKLNQIPISKVLDILGLDPSVTP